MIRQFVCNARELIRDDRGGTAYLLAFVQRRYRCPITQIFPPGEIASRKEPDHVAITRIADGGAVRLPALAPNAARRIFRIAGMRS